MYLHVGFLDESNGINQSSVGRDLITPKRHITNQERRGGATRNGATVVQHVGHGDARGVGVPQCNLE